MVQICVRSLGGGVRCTESLGGVVGGKLHERKVKGIRGHRLSQQTHGTRSYPWTYTKQGQEGKLHKKLGDGDIFLG